MKRKEEVEKYQKALKAKLAPAERILRDFHDSYYEKMLNLQNNINYIFAPLIEALQEINPYNIILRAYAILGKNQVFVWNINSIEEANEIISSKNIDEYLKSKLDDRRYFDINKIINKCNKTKILSNLNKKILLQCIETMNQNMYDLALIGVSAVIDGGLSNASGNHVSVNISERLNIIVTKFDNKNYEINNEDIELAGIYCSWVNSMKSYSKRVSFNKKEEEPSDLNRHWIVHGRKTYSANKLDCIKALGFLYGLVIFSDY